MIRRRRAGTQDWRVTSLFEEFATSWQRIITNGKRKIIKSTVMNLAGITLQKLSLIIFGTAWFEGYTWLKVLEPLIGVTWKLSHLNKLEKTLTIYIIAFTKANTNL